MNNLSRFKNILFEQISLLKRNCDDYDFGNYHSAKHIGLIARVLFHDTGNSKSLLTHLSLNNINMLSTVEPFDQGIPLIPTMGKMTLSISISPLGNKYTGTSLKPILGTSTYNENIPFLQWWNQTIAVYDGHKVDRKAMICDIVNKEGGAHVDEATKEWIEYSSIFKFEERINDIKIDNSHLPKEYLLYLRQIGYEILNSKDLLYIIQDKLVNNETTTKNVEFELKIAGYYSLLKEGENYFISGDILSSRKIYNKIIKALDASIINQEVLVLIKTYKDLALTYEDTESRIKIYEQAINIIYLKSCHLNKGFYEIITIIEFDLAQTFNKNGQDELAINFFNNIYKRCKKNFLLYKIEYDSDAILLYYGLTSAINLSVVFEKSNNIHEVFKWLDNCEDIIKLLLEKEEWSLKDVLDKGASHSYNLITNCIYDYFEKKLIMYVTYVSLSNAVDFLKYFIKDIDFDANEKLNSIINEFNHKLNINILNFII